MMENEIVRRRYETLAPRLLEALRRRGYEAWFRASAAEAGELALSLILPEDTVAWGGSMTLEATGVLSRLRAGGYDLIDRDAARTPEERMDLMRRALTCGTYFASVNAMTEDGEMVNIDGNGNRVAAIAFGPKRVVLVVGMNKVCGDLSAAVLSLLIRIGGNLQFILLDIAVPKLAAGPWNILKAYYLAMVNNLTVHDVISGKDVIVFHYILVTVVILNVLTLPIV